MISNKPCIAISLRIVKAQNYDETRDALSHDWPQFLENLGIIPIYIPNNLLNVKNYLSAFEIDGLILSGGDNLGTDLVRDKTETELLQYAMSKNIPTLGICRGLQLINQYFGGSITENNSDSHVGTKHHLDIVDKKLEKILNTSEINTNSFHRNTILDSDLSSELTPIAIHREDNTVEAALHNTLPILGLMWHPERGSDNYENYDKEIVNSIFKKRLF